MKEILSDDACFYRRLIKDIKKASGENEECPDLKKINTKQIDEIFHEEMFEGEFPLYEHKSKHMIVECFRGKEKDPNNITFAVIKMPKKIYIKFGRVSLQDVFLSKYYKKCKMKTVYFNSDTEIDERCNLLIKLVKYELPKERIDKDIFIYNGNNMNNTSLLKIYSAAFAGFGLLFSLGMFLFVNGAGVIQGILTDNWELLELDPIEWLALAFMSGFMFSTLFFIIIGIIWTYGVIKER